MGKKATKDIPASLREKYDDLAPGCFVGIAPPAPLSQSLFPADREAEYGSHEDLFHLPPKKGQ